MLATKKDLQDIKSSLADIDLQIYNMQKGIQNLCDEITYLKNGTVKSKPIYPKIENLDFVGRVPIGRSDSGWMTLANKECVDKQYEETKNKIIDLQIQITNLKKSLDFHKTLHEYYNLKVEQKNLPNWITDYSPTHSLEVIIDSQKSTIIKMQNEEKKYLKKIQELEYANKTIQDDNTKLNAINNEIGHRNAQLRIDYDKRIEQLEYKIKILEMEKKDLIYENRRIKFFN